MWKINDIMVGTVNNARGGLVDGWASLAESVASMREDRKFVSSSS